MKVKIFLFISILVFIIVSFILIVQFFKYTSVDEEETYIRDGILPENKNYMLSDITDVEASCKLGYKHKIYYNIHLNGGTIVNPFDSKDFFSNITNLDNFIKNKGIKINRNSIKANDYGEFTNVFDDDKMKIINLILDK